MALQFDKMEERVEGLYIWILQSIWLRQCSGWRRREEGGGGGQRAEKGKKSKSFDESNQRHGMKFPSFPRESVSLGFWHLPPRFVCESLRSWQVAACRRVLVWRLTLNLLRIVLVGIMPSSLLFIPMEGAPVNFVIGAETPTHFAKRRLTLIIMKSDKQKNG